MHTGMDKEAARGIVRSMALQSAGPDLNSSSAEPGARVRRVRHPPQARNLKGRQQTRYSDGFILIRSFNMIFLKV